MSSILLEQYNPARKYPTRKIKKASFFRKKAFDAFNTYGSYLKSVAYSIGRSSNAMRAAA